MNKDDLKQRVDRVYASMAKAPPAPVVTSADIAEQTKAFLAAGGTITQCPTGAVDVEKAKARDAEYTKARMNAATLRKRAPNITVTRRKLYDT